jgi:predicted HAD superfamily phosphohydrolase YqeG
MLTLADHQLNFFNCLNQEGDHQLTLKRLKALGFNSIIFDTNTQTIEKDPNGSLHKKVENFVSFVNDTSVQLNIVVNDPGNGIAYMLLP